MRYVRATIYISCYNLLDLFLTLGGKMSKLQTQLTMMMLAIGVMVVAGLWGMTLPLEAQGRPFATNTPVRGFATNTPENLPVTQVTPDSDCDQYTRTTNTSTRSGFGI